jgi:heptosyltransferase-2
MRAPNWLGDAVLALPAMAAVRAHFPSAHLTVAASSSVAALFREGTDAYPDQVLDLPAEDRAAVAALRAGRFDIGVLFPNSFRSAWQMRRAGIPERWGYARGLRGWLLTRRALRPEGTRGRGPEHHVDFYRNLIRGLGIPCDEVPPRVEATARSREGAQRALRGWAQDAVPYVLVAPGAAYGQAKQWPPDRVAEVVVRLMRDRGVRVVLIGAGHDRAAGMEIESRVRAAAPEQWTQLRNLIGQTDLGTLVALAERARVCITNDSGAMHVASATGCPIVVPFGPTDERVTRPVGRAEVLTADVFCRPCHLRDCPIDHRCMRRITVDQVFQATSRHLAFKRSDP